MTRNDQMTHFCPQNACIPVKQRQRRHLHRYSPKAQRRDANTPSWNIFAAGIADLVHTGH